MNGQRGMTLVELMVSMVIVLLIMVFATAAYLKLLKDYKTQGKMSESYMTNLCGLELLRYDIEMAGFGLPANNAAGSYTYTEAGGGGPNPYDPAALNDAAWVASSPQPLPFVLLNNWKPAYGSSDVLAIKSAVANTNPTTGKWSMMRMVNGAPQVMKWGGATQPNFDVVPSTDRFIVLNGSGSLVLSGANYCFTFDTGYFTNAASKTTNFNNALSTPMTASSGPYYLYGLDSSTTGRNMPFNRVDYYLDSANVPTSCTGTFTLYRATYKPDGTPDLQTPIIDCVKDFQVAFYVNNAWQQTLPATDSRNVREVRAFVLVREGTGDTGKKASFRFTDTLYLGDPQIANDLVPGNNFQQLSSSSTLTGALHKFTPTGTDTQYRWKILQIAVKPMNLN